MREIIPSHNTDIFENNDDLMGAMLCILQSVFFVGNVEWFKNELFLEKKEI